MNTIISIPEERIMNEIYVIRGKKVMFDSDLAGLYEVSTKRLNEQVKRNLERFPADFMFQLSRVEFDDLRSQIATSNRGGQRYRPFVFTEQGVAMLSSVLNSSRAIKVNIQIIRTFTKLREILVSNKGLADKIQSMERKYDSKISRVFELLEKLTSIEKKPKEKIGFRSN